MMNMYAYIHTSQLLLTAAYPDLNVEFKGPSICEPMGNINEVSSHPQALSPRLGKFTETEFRLVVSKEGEEGREKLLNK